MNKTEENILKDILYDYRILLRQYQDVMEKLDKLEEENLGLRNLKSEIEWQWEQLTKERKLNVIK